MVSIKKTKAFTLIELLVVVAIIGILAAVGVVAYNGYTKSAKVSVARTNYNTLVKHMKAELMKCNNGLVGTMFTSNPVACPMTHINNWSSGMNNECRVGEYSKMINPYINQSACRLAIEYTRDVDVGFVNWSTYLQTFRLSSCWKTPCSDHSNREQLVINVLD